MGKLFKIFKNCPKCGKNITPNNWQKHINRIAPCNTEIIENESYLCQICNTYKKSSDYKKHLWRHHIQKKENKLEKLLEKYKKRQAPENCITCIHCSKQLTKSSIQAHIKKIHKNN